MSEKKPTPATETLYSIAIAMFSLTAIVGMVVFCGLLIRACRWGAGL